ncbi:MAG: PP2C family protein-serine/threonine phosphatase [Deltaproteobacteria bacterium]
MEVQSLLARQLKKVGHSNLDAAPSNEVWRKLLKRISDHYKHMDDDREMLMRSLEVSTNEMSSISSDMGHSVSKELLEWLAEALNAMSAVGDSSQVGSVQAATQRLEGIEVAFLERLGGLGTGVGGDNTPEVTALRHHFVTLSDVIKRMLEERASHREMEREIEVARSVQKLLLPDASEFHRPFLDVSADSQAASVCSGDWWAVHDLPDGRVLVVLGDVTGHGVPAGIMTGVAKASCDVTRAVYGDKLQAGQLLTLMNRAVESAGQQQLLMTCVVAIFNPHDRVLTIANAGHVLPYIVRPSSGRHHISTVRAHGTPLGASHDASYREVRVSLETDDMFIFYTDGLIEREGPSGEQFGHRRLQSVLEQTAGFGAAGVKDSLLHHLARHAEGLPNTDDVTLVVARFGEGPQP